MRRPLPMAPGWPTIILLYAMGVLAASASAKAAPIALDIARSLNASVQDVGWTMSSVFLALLVGAAIGGWLVGRLGNRPVIFASFGLIAASDAVAAWTTNIWVMGVTRAVEGIGFLGVITACPASIMAMTRGKQQTQAMALWSSFAAGGYATGVVLAAPFAGTDRWPFAFLVHGVLCVLAGTAAWSLPRDESSARGSAQTAHGRAQTTHALRTFAEPDVVRLATGFGLICMASFGVNLVGPVYLSKTHPLSVAAVSSLIAVATLANIVAGVATGAVISRGAHLPKFALVLSLTAATAAILMYAPVVSAVMALSALALWIVTMGAMTAVIMALLPRVLRNHARAAPAAGLMNQAAGLGAFAAPPLYFGALGTGSPLLMSVLAISTWPVLLMLLPLRGGQSDLPQTYLEPDNAGADARAERCSGVRVGLVSPKKDSSMNAISLKALGGGYAPQGWIQWPDDLDFSFQFLRALGAAQDGASTISECFLAASRIVPGDRDSWHQEWLRLGEVSLKRAQQAEGAGSVESAKSNWLRAANYFRSAEFFLDPNDTRRLPTFDLTESCSHRYLALLSPKGEVVRIPYEKGAYLSAYFLRSPVVRGRQATVIACGGLDEFKDELIQEMAKYALPRGISLLLVDLPGQGGTLRRLKVAARPDTEVPVGRCIDYLLTRSDVDPNRIAFYGASLGGYYAARAASFEHRLACTVVDGAQWKLSDGARRVQTMPDSVTAMLCKWVFDCSSLEELQRKSASYSLEGVVKSIRCPVLIVHGEADEWGVEMASILYKETKDAGVDVELKLFSAEETGASHCQIDNPTLGQELICDWLARRLGTLEELSSSAAAA